MERAILKFTKFIFFTAMLFLFFAHESRAATTTFNDESWEIEGVSASSALKIIIRNDFELPDYSKNVFFGNKQDLNELLFDEKTLSQIYEAKNSINQKSRSAEMKIENGKAVRFDPGQVGQALDVYTLSRMLWQSENFPAPVYVSRPQKILWQTNLLGIKELIATGESDFSGSSRNRRVNIQVGSSKFNGVIVKPGEEFSFNSHLGAIDAENGYLPEVVIKKDGLVAEFGGGLCQVSSTTFRAAMNAGLNITQRRNHSFAVRYYAPQGTDATVYPGVVDLKFINDTPAHMMIWTRTEGNKLYFDFYGTRDQREIVLEGPVQYDKRASGAMKATWTKKVTNNGQTNEQVFNSTYVSPALYQSQTTVQASTPNPDAPTPPEQTAQPPPPAPDQNQPTT
jgi:vancomycin resistance protein YoaR